jgi:hypothetical protein
MRWIPAAFPAEHVLSLHFTDERNGAAVTHGFSGDDWRHGGTFTHISSSQGQRRREDSLRRPPAMFVDAREW